MISRCNQAAWSAGARPGQSTATAAAHMLTAPPGTTRTLTNPCGDRDFLLLAGANGGIYGCWSMSLPRGDAATEARMCSASARPSIRR